jgi:hypothetical protein
MTNAKKPGQHAPNVSTANAWFKTYPAHELEILDMANARQIALRTRLRHRYWVTSCAPLTPSAVERVCKKMALIDDRDAMTDAEVEELLTPDFGFAAVDSGWTVPDLDAARGEALGSIDAIRSRMSELGRASAAKRGKAAADVAAEPVSVGPEVDDEPTEATSGTDF